MKNEIPSWGMFSEEGNLAVEEIVRTSKTFEEAQDKLFRLTKKHMEAIDTAVREAVFVAFETPKHKRKIKNI